MGRILDFVELVGSEWGLPDLPVPTAGSLGAAEV